MVKMAKNKQSWLKKKYQLYIRDLNNLEEKGLLKFTYIKGIVWSAVIVVFFLALSLALVSTILSKWLHPEYLEKQNRDRISQLNTVIDSLETEVENQSNFIKVMQNAIEGKNDESAAQAYKIYKDYYDNISNKKDDVSNITLNNLLFFRPAMGIITNKFDPEVKHYGIDIAAEEGESIKSIADGIVILSSFTIDSGCVIVIQHSNDLLSVYKHSSLLLKKVGNFVKKGEVIGNIGSSGELSSGPHLHFEMWSNGNPMNPELFIKIN
jgi:murein DD-endopeptidase MepM/ murein hydrolase activator NlpD